MIGQSSCEVVLESSEGGQRVEGDVDDDGPDVGEEEADLKQNPVIVTLQDQSFILCRGSFILA